MDIFVLNDNFEKIAIVDNYESLIWTKRYNEVSGLDLKVEATTENIRLFKRGYFIIREDDDTVFRIEAIELDTSIEEGDYLIIGGYSAEHILSQRIIWTQVNFNPSTGNTVERYIRILIDKNIINPVVWNPDTKKEEPMPPRRIPNFHLKELRGFEETIAQQVTYDNLEEKIQELCQTYEYGWKVTLEDGNLYFDLYKGVDHSEDSSQPIIFSPSNENLATSKYTSDFSEYKNCALVAGKGEGLLRSVRTIGGNLEGLKRYEMYVDADGIESKVMKVNEETGEEEEVDLYEVDRPAYYKLLISKGNDELAKVATTAKFEGEVDWINIRKIIMLVI